MLSLSEDSRKASAASRGLPPAADIFIGRDILGLLVKGIYIDPLSVIREYVQNAADSIEEAIEFGLLGGNGEEGRVEIHLNSQSRVVRIRDNGVGLGPREGEAVLLALGHSPKRGKGRRGFRGIGRLGGLGFSRAVTFRTRSVDHDDILEVCWDCHELRTILADPHDQGSVQRVISRVAQVRRYQEPGELPHFFEVQLEGVVRISGDALLNPEAIESYLSQVAPVPFQSQFSFGRDIDHYLRQFNVVGRHAIYINGSPKAIRRPHRDDFNVTATKYDRFRELQLIRLENERGDLAAVGWLLHHGYSGAIRGSTELRGIRARFGDMQIGNSEIFQATFPEPRFNSWAVGEVHILDPGIIPDGRREGFELNNSFAALLNQLLPIARAVSQRCRRSSKVRNRLKAFERLRLEIEERFAIVEQGATTRQHIKEDLTAAAGALRELERIASDHFLSVIEQARLQREIRDLRQELKKLQTQNPSNETIARMSPTKRAAYQRFISLIYESAPNKTVAKGIVDRIVARLGEE